MIFESTGEIRQPEYGEMFLCGHPNDPTVLRLVLSTTSWLADGPHVIMRPVSEIVTSHTVTTAVRPLDPEAWK